jgi:hypothetical protein
MFFATVNQTSTIYTIEFGNTLQPIVRNCQWNGGGGTFQMGSGMDFTGTNSGNGAVIDSCNFGQLLGTWINFNGGQGSSIVSNCLGNGQNANSTNSVSGITVQANSSGASGGGILLVNTDIIKCTNNLVINAASSYAVSSVYAVDCYFDQGISSALLIEGAGSVTRCRFSGCWFTPAQVSTVGYGVEINATTWAGIYFNDCWILNAAGAGTNTNTASFGLIASAGGSQADLILDNCQIAGWSGATGGGVSVTSGTAGGTIVKVENCTIGPCAGLTAQNTVGITLLGSVTYGNVTIQGNVLNSTTPLSLVSGFAVASGSQFYLSDNLGLPCGASTTAYTGSSVLAATTVTTVGSLPVPANSLRAGQRFRAQLYMTTAATAGTCTIALTLGTASTSIASIVATNPADTGSWAVDAEIIMTSASACTCFVQVKATTTDTTFVDTAEGIGSGTTTASGIADASATTLNITADASAASTWTVWGANIEVLQQ